MAAMSDHIDSLRSQVRAIPVSSPPAPWTAMPPIAVGGLTHIGVATAVGAEYLLVISHSGRGVFNEQGVLVARDRGDEVGDWIDEVALEATGIGPIEGQRVRLAGLTGGGLPTITADGWSLDSLPVDWPQQRVVLQPPGTGALWPGHEQGCVVVFTDYELRAHGFSPSGRLLILASSSDLCVFTRG